MGSTFIDYITRDNKLDFIMANNKSLRDCPILNKECETVRQAIITTIKKNILIIIIYSDS